MWVPDAAHEALRYLVRAREDAREDQQRARQQLGKFLLRHGFQRPKDIKEGWTQKLMAWIKSQVRLEQAASQAAFLDYVHEVERATDRLQQLEKAIDDAIAAARQRFKTNLRKNVFHCFSCGAGGMVLDFVAAMDRCSLREAALKLACAMPEPLAPKIMPMRFRPADIRVINRRKLPLVTSPALRPHTLRQRSEGADENS